MAIWQSFDPFQALQREIENAFERVGPHFSPMSRSAFLPGRAARDYPLINLYEEQNQIRVEALAPGVEPNSFNISMVGRTLTIAGEKPRASGEVKPEAFHREERAAGRFTRNVAILLDVVAHSSINGASHEGSLSGFLDEQ